MININKSNTLLIFIWPILKMIFRVVPKIPCFFALFLTEGAEDEFPHGQYTRYDKKVFWLVKYFYICQHGIINLPCFPNLLSRSYFLQRVVKNEIIIFLFKIMNLTFNVAVSLELGTKVWNCCSLSCGCQTFLFRNFNLIRKCQFCVQDMHA